MSNFRHYRTRTGWGERAINATYEMGPHYHQPPDPAVVKPLITKMQRALAHVFRFTV